MTLIIIAAIALCHSSMAQELKLWTKKPKKEFEVLNNNYKIYFSTEEVIQTIYLVDKQTKQKHSKLTAAIRDKKVTSIDLNSEDLEMQPFIYLLKSNLGAYLLLQGHAYILFNKKSVVPTLNAEASPPIHEEDGNSRTPIYFAAKGSKEPAFLGDIDQRLLTYFQSLKK